MNVLFFLWKTFTLRGLKQYLSRSLFTVVGIVLATTIVLAIQLATTSAKHHFDSSLTLISGNATLQVTSTNGQNFNQSILSKLGWLWDENAKFTPISSQPVLIQTKSNITPKVVTVFGVDLFADKAFRSFEPTENESSQGTLNDQQSIFSPGKVLVPQSFSDEYNLKPASQFKVIQNDKEITLTVAGIMQNSKTASAYNGELMVMDIGSYQKTFSETAQIQQIDIITPVDKTKSIQKKLQLTLPVGLQVNPPQFKNDQVNQLLSAYHANLSALSFIAFLVSLFLIYNTLSISVTRRRHEVGILKSLGLSKKQVLALFLGEAFTLSIIGVALGLLCGCGLATLMISSTSATVQNLYTGIPASTVYYDPIIISMVAVISMGLVLIASIPPVLEAASIPASIAVEREAQELQFKKVINWLVLLAFIFLLGAWGSLQIQPVNSIPVGGYLCSLFSVLMLTSLLPFLLNQLFSLLKPLLNFLPLPVSYGVKLLSATIGKTSVTVASLMVGLSLMVSMAIMIESFRTSVQDWVNQTLKADVWIQPKSRSVTRFYGALDQELSQWLQKQPEVEVVDNFTEKRITYRGQPCYIGAGQSEVIAQHGGVRLVDNREARPVIEKLKSENAILISESFSNKFKVKEGDIIEIETPLEKNLKLKVLGIYWDYSSENGYMIMDRSLYEKQYKTNEVTSLAVYTYKHSDAKALQAKIYSHFNHRQLVIQTNQELKNHVMTIFNATFSITYALHGISIVIALLTITNTLFALILTAKRDLTLLKTLGYSLKQIQQTIVVQALCIGILGGGLGLLSGSLLALILIQVIQVQSFGWQIPIHWPTGFLVQTFFITVVTSFIAGAFPARFAKNLIKNEVIRNE